MKLVFTSYAGSPGFVQPQVWLDRIEGYIGILQRLSGHHQVISIERINYEGKLSHQGVYYVFMRMKKRKIYFPFRMHRLIKHLEPHVVFVNGFIFPLQIIQLRWKLGNRAKIIVLHRAEKPFKGFRKYFQMMADKCVDHYFFISSEFGKEWVQSGIISNINKIEEVVQASSSFGVVDKAVARAMLTIPAVPVFLWVGRLDANKDPFTVVKAFIKFLQIQPSARLYMIFHEHQLLQEIKDLVNSDDKAKLAIHLVGRLPHRQLQEWYSSADYIISGSHYEGSGVAVIEAMSCGCIPIVTDIISFRKLTGISRCGLLYEPGNENTLLTALIKTQQLDIEIEREKVLHRFYCEFSFEAIAQKINDVINISFSKPVLNYAEV